MKISEILKEDVSLPVYGKFTFAGIKYDNESGLGAVSDNRNVLYKGFAAIMHVDDFLKLAHKADRSDDAKKFADMMIDEDVAIACPFLSIMERDDSDGITGDDLVVIGHEGRGRAHAVKLLADGYRKEDQKRPVSGIIVVHFFPRFYRSRDLKPEFFKTMKLKGIIGQDGNHVRPNFKGIIHDPTWR